MGPGAPNWLEESNVNVDQRFLTEDNLLGRTERCQVYRYDEGGKLSVAVLKMARDPSRNGAAGLADEYSILQRLKSALSEASERGSGPSHEQVPAALVPDPIGFGQVAGCDALQMSVITGRSLEDLVTSGEKQPVPTWLAALTLGRLFQLVHVVHKSLMQTLPDFKRNNIRVGSTSVGVIDWNVLAPYSSSASVRDRQTVAQYSSELVTGQYSDSVEALRPTWDKWSHEHKSDLRWLLAAAGNEELSPTEIASRALRLARQERDLDLREFNPVRFTYPSRLRELATTVGWPCGPPTVESTIDVGFPMGERGAK